MKKLLPVLLCVLSATYGGATFAQDYPNRPVKLVVGYAPGGFTDVVARLVASDLQRRLGQPIVVENRPGATGTIAANSVKQATPDGYTLLLAHQNSNAVAPALFPNLPYNVNTDFTPIAQLASTALLLVVGPKTPANNVLEVVELAKKTPGSVRYGSSGVGSSQHFGAAIFAQNTQIEMLHIPYKGSAQSLTDLMSGQIELNFDSPPPSLQFINSGRLRALGITSKTRSPLLPDVPTMAEAGVPGLEFSQWFGIVGPAHLPPDIVKKLNEAVNASLQYSEIRSKIVALGADPLGGTPEDFSKIIAKDSADFAALTKKLNITLE